MSIIPIPDDTALFENASYEDFVNVIRPLLEETGDALNEGNATAMNDLIGEHMRRSDILSLINSVRDSTAFENDRAPRDLRVSTDDMSIRFVPKDDWRPHPNMRAVVDVSNYPDFVHLRFTHVPLASVK